MLYSPDTLNISKWNIAHSYVLDFMFIFSVCVCVGGGASQYIPGDAHLIFGKIEKRKTWCFYGDLIFFILDCGKHFGSDFP